MSNIDIDKIASLYAKIMEELHLPITSENVETPKRVAKALVEFSGADVYNKFTAFEFAPQLATSFATVEISQIPVRSLCAHHHLPFFGECTITYIPNKSILGLSKFPRLVEKLSKSAPTTQESLTIAIATFLKDLLECNYIAVTITAQHTCCSCRGANANVLTKTSYEL